MIYMRKSMFTFMHMCLYDIYAHDHVYFYTNLFIWYICTRACLSLCACIYMIHMHTSMFTFIQMCLYDTYAHEHVESYAHILIWYICTRACLLSYTCVYMIYMHMILSAQTYTHTNNLPHRPCIYNWLGTWSYLPRPRPRQYDPAYMYVHIYIYIYVYIYIYRRDVKWVCTHVFFLCNGVEG